MQRVFIAARTDLRLTKKINVIPKNSVDNYNILHIIGKGVITKSQITHYPKEVNMYNELRTYYRCEGLDEYYLRSEARASRREKAAGRAAEERIAENNARPLKAGIEWLDTTSPAKVIE